MMNSAIYQPENVIREIHVYCIWYKSIHIHLRWRYAIEIMIGSNIDNSVFAVISNLGIHSISKVTYSDNWLWLRSW